MLALKEQNRLIGQLRREANSNFMLLDDRSRQTQDLVQTLVGKVGPSTAGSLSRTCRCKCIAFLCVLSVSKKQSIGGIRRGECKVG